MRRDEAVERRPSRRGRLRPDELAEAVILADLTLALCLVGHVLPLASALFAAAIVPMAAVSARHRLRAVAAGTAAACVVGFLIAGGGLLTSGRPGATSPGLGSSASRPDASHVDGPAASRIGVEEEVPWWPPGHAPSVDYRS